MNRLLSVVAVAAVVSFGCGTTSVPDGGARGGRVDLSASQEVVLTVHGLSCPLCANNLDGQLRRIEGVEKASIDLKTGAVTVVLAEGHSVSSGDLAGAVENAGFTLKKIESKGAGE
jgi:copper chaperone CopZ